MPVWVEELNLIQGKLLIAGDEADVDCLTPCPILLCSTSIVSPAIKVSNYLGTGFVDRATEIRCVVQTTIKSTITSLQKQSGTLM